MPLLLEKKIDKHMYIGVWHCTESLSELEASEFFPEVDQKEINNTKILKRKSEKIITRLLAKYLLENNFGLKYKGLVKLKTGKPVFTDSTIEISVSHCDMYLTVIVTNHIRAGIDLQNLNKKISKVSTRVFSENELVQINNSDLLMARAWSAKEAMFKYYEKGNINFIRDLELYNLKDENNFYGILKKEGKRLRVNLGTLQITPTYQLVYCYEK